MYNGLTTIDLFCSLRFNLSVMEIQVCKVIAYFPGVTRHKRITRILEASRNTLMARNAREICNYFAHLYLHNG